MAETRLEAVRRILNTATDQGTPGHPSHGGKGRFWNLPRNQFVAAVVLGQQVIVLGQPENSAMIKALRGLPPFTGAPFPLMPKGRPPVGEPDIAFIEQWIRDGCPENDGPEASGGEPQ